MSRLTVYTDNNPETPVIDTTDGADITAKLKEIDVRFERWEAAKEFASDAPDADVLEAYEADIQRIMQEGGYQTVDILRCNDATPDKPAIRAKFLNEHTHSEDEVRFFVEGAGIFYLRTNGHVYMALCERGDLISVPAGVTHWFDMGPNPNIAALRFFDNKEGWVPHFTGSDIAEKFPKFEKAA
ncbi:MAG: cupin [Alphaproteobacteria bacterium]|nr:cupin [Alphaproteobacteria bacterium]MCD8520356.1 cupin [Alphaproteobacteria bacterium]MCD8526117.1 cupin [Alphaproteobacteria bacterium]MCD8570474.1 cupin [Alphaproteobacteria bacterium]